MSDLSEVQTDLVKIKNTKCWQKIHLVLFTNLKSQLLHIFEEIVVVILVWSLGRVEEDQHQEYSIILLD